MFDIGWPELFVIALVALVVIGPKDLPRVMRYVGRWFGKAKRVTWEFKQHWDDIMRESELDDVRREIEEVARTDPAAYAEKSIDPNREIREAFEFGGEELVNVKMPELPPPDSRDYGIAAPVAAPAKEIAASASSPGAPPLGTPPLGASDAGAPQGGSQVGGPQVSGAQAGVADKDRQP